MTRSRLVRRHHSRKIAGVCAGMAEYFNADPALVRVIWLALLFLGGIGLPLYLILWIVMPLED
ncbi:MAG: PspC domain-containing protein [bacterium]|nr:PspC domain-containing protein [bacterium]